MGENTTGSDAFRGTPAAGKLNTGSVVSTLDSSERRFTKCPGQPHSDAREGNELRCHLRGRGEAPAPRNRHVYDSQLQGNYYEETDDCRCQRKNASPQVRFKTVGVLTEAQKSPGAWSATWERSGTSIAHFQTDRVPYLVISSPM